MGVNTSKISLYRGDSKSLTLNFTDSNGNVVDITGGTVTFTLKNSKDDLDADAVIQKSVTSHSNPTGGISKIDILASETQGLSPNVYRYDIQILLPGGLKKTVAFGDFEVIGDITRA